MTASCRLIKLQLVGTLANESVVLMGKILGNNCHQCIILPEFSFSSLLKFQEATK